MHIIDSNESVWWPMAICTFKFILLKYIKRINILLRPNMTYTLYIRSQISNSFTKSVHTHGHKHTHPEFGLFFYQMHYKQGIDVVSSPVPVHLNFACGGSVLTVLRCRNNLPYCALWACCPQNKSCQTASHKGEESCHALWKKKHNDGYVNQNTCTFPHDFSEIHT